MARLPSTQDMIRELIALPSMSSVNPAFDTGNAAVVERLAQWAEELGFRVRIEPIPGSPGKCNLIARLGQGSGGLVLSGHTDTVPYDEGRWSRDPFILQERDGRLYGLGSSDMKGFFALALSATRGLRGKDLNRPLTLVATADEESSMSGARALLEAGERLGDYALIGEPTGLRPIRQHKGIFMESIRLLGRSGHSSDPGLGVSALEGMAEVIGELGVWRRELQQCHHNPAFAVPIPTLNLGHIHGGDNPNRICGQCELHIDLRPLPGMDLNELRQELAQRLRQRLQDSALVLEIEPLFGGVPALETSARSPLVTTCEGLSGHPAGAVAFATEGPYFRRLGMDTVVLGPGSIDQAHQPDEYLELTQIQPGIELLRALIQRFCIAPSQPPPEDPRP